MNSLFLSLHMRAPYISQTVNILKDKKIHWTTFHVFHWWVWDPLNRNLVQSASQNKFGSVGSIKDYGFIASGRFLEIRTNSDKFGQIWTIRANPSEFFRIYLNKFLKIIPAVWISLKSNTILDHRINSEEWMKSSIQKSIKKGDLFE